MSDPESKYSPDQPKIVGADVIYRPKSEAGEYAALATNPYKGCGHCCAYCLSPATLILMADGTAKRLAQVEIGDKIIGIKKRATVRRAWNYSYVEAEVLNKITTSKQAYRVNLDGGYNAICSADHRWLTERGWKTTSALTLNNDVRMLAPLSEAEEQDDGYKRGYLTGVILGDGLLKRFDYSGRFTRKGRKSPQKTDVQHQFRLAMLDTEALLRATLFLAHFGIEVTPFTFKHAGGPMPAIRANSAAAFEAIKNLVLIPGDADRQWARGFLAGIFDAEGSNSDVIRISNKNPTVLLAIESAATMLAFEAVRDKPNKDTGVIAIRLLGGLPERVRFFNVTAPAIQRKFNIEGAALKGSARIASIEKLAGDVEMMDITTSTENFIANGMISHNCYVPGATHQKRPDFDAGAVPRPDFIPRLRRDVERYRAGGICDGHSADQVFITFSSDPFHPGPDLKPTIETMQILIEAGMSFCTLSKGGTRALEFGPIYRPGRDAYAATLTTLDDDFSRKWERKAHLPGDRIEALKRFHSNGIYTWVSLEPTLDVEASLSIVRATHGFVDLYKIGKANYLKGITKDTDWKTYTLRMIDLCHQLGVRHYIKRDLQQFLPAGYDNPLRVAQHH